MSIFEIALISVGTAVLLLSLFAKNTRGAFWVAAILVDLVLSTAYWRSGLPYADVTTALCDSAICVLVYLFGMHRWELWVFLLFLSSFVVSMVDLGVSIRTPGGMDHDTYSSMLEAINYVSFLLVGGISGLALAGGSDFPSAPWRVFRPAFLPLLSQRSEDRR